MIVEVRGWMDREGRVVWLMDEHTQQFAMVGSRAADGWPFSPLPAHLQTYRLADDGWYREVED